MLSLVTESMTHCESGTTRVQRDAVALGAGLVAPAQDGGVVAADLGVAGAVGGGAVKLVEDEGLDGVDAVVDAGRDDEDGKGVLVGRREAELGARAVDLGAHVHGGARGVRRHKGGVEGDGGAAGVEEGLLGHAGHRGDVGRVLEAQGVAVGPEEGDRVVAGAAEGLEALVRLLAVVEGRRHAVDAHKGRRHELERRPLAGRLAVGGLDVAVDWRCRLSEDKTTG
ncbi:hypothetical protein VDGD_21652 [Verticillium dahliae]|nr:hypothetical protein VDGD_21652 [Verticillium dahliae]